MYYKNSEYGYIKSTLHCLHDIYLSEKQEKYDSNRHKKFITHLTKTNNPHVAQQ